MTARVALYWTPDGGDPLGRFGAHWLGRDAETDAPLAQPEVPALARRGLDLAEITSSPRHYGFHATLKAPFAPVGGTPEALIAAAEAFSAATPPVEGPRLVPAVLGGFVVLVPDGPSPAVDAFAHRVVEAFEPFRAPLDDGELARRRRAGLNGRQERYLLEWGYPYVFEEFFFHMTLSQRLAPDDAEAVRSAIVERAALVADRPLRIDALCLFEQPARDRPFRLSRRFCLRG